MLGEFLLPLFMRWFHVLSAIVAVGGVIFLWGVLRPAAKSVLGEAEHAALREAVRRRWQKYVHGAILLFLISGFYNYLVVLGPQHQGQPIYHALFGLKFLIALVVFGIALALTSGKAWSERMRSNSGTWLGVLVTLAVVVVLISGYLRMIPRV